MEPADVDGVQLEYEVSGTGDPIVFIHGAFIADSFGPLLAEPALAGGYRLITYRRRGYGRSRTVNRTAISAERQAADCASLLRSIGVERTHVVGHSFGGCVASSWRSMLRKSCTRWFCWSPHFSWDQALRPIGSRCCGVASGIARRVPAS